MINFQHYLLADARATNYLLHGSLVCIDFLHKFLFNFLNKIYHFEALLNEAVNTNWWQPSMAKQPAAISHPENELPPPVRPRPRPRRSQKAIIPSQMEVAPLHCTVDITQKRRLFKNTKEIEKM